MSIDSNAEKSTRLGPTPVSDPHTATWPSLSYREGSDGAPVHVSDPPPLPHSPPTRPRLTFLRSQLVSRPLRRRGARRAGGRGHGPTRRRNRWPASGCAASTERRRLCRSRRGGGGQRADRGMSGPAKQGCIQGSIRSTSQDTPKPLDPKSKSWTVERIQDKTETETSLSHDMFLFC